MVWLRSLPARHHCAWQSPELVVPSGRCGQAMDFAVHIHQSGQYQGLPIYEPNLMSIRDGGRATLVAHIVIWDENDEHLCKGHLTKQFFKLCTKLPKGTDCITVINAKIHQLRGPVLTIDDSAKTLVHPPCTMQSLERLSETCGGLGALGVGAEHAGFQVVTLNDIQSSFCEQVKQDGRCNVVHGDICKMPTVIDIHEQGEGAAIFAFGFNCQPFSSLGDNRQGLDERSSSLTYGLYAAYLLQMKVVILECVTNALRSKFVKVGIQHYINHTDAFRSDEVLELAHLWPSYRRRWWCVLSHPAIGKIPLQPLPKLSHTPTMSDLMPKFMDVTPEELEQLLLTEHEQSMFLSLSGGNHPQVLDIHSTLATALHSWGNQCIKCKCGCGREFSFQRLKSEGIHGALIFIHNSFPGKSLRHMSAREMAIFTGFPRHQGWTGDQRMLTAGVGQLASSIQSAWVFGIIRQHLKTIKFLPQDEMTPKSSVASVCFSTIDLQQQWMGNSTTIEMDMFRESLEELLVEKKSPSPIKFPLHQSPQAPVPIQSEAEVAESMVAPHDGSDSVNSGLKQEGVENEDNRHEVTPNEPGSPEDFNRVLAKNIGDIEQSLTDLAKVVDLSTGGIHAFASVQAPVIVEDRGNIAAKRETPNVEGLTSGGGTGGIPAFSSGEFPPLKKSRIEEDARAEHQHEQPPAVDEHSPQEGRSHLYNQVVPADLLEEKTVIYDVAVQQAWAIKVAQGQTVADMNKAIQLLTGEHSQVHDELGRQCPPETLIENQVYMINFDASKLSDDLVARAQSLQPLPRWQSLLQQGGAVAIDEMDQYLSMIASESKVAYVPPVFIGNLHDCHDFKQHWEQAIQQHDTKTITAVCFHNHWIPFVFEHHSELKIYTTAEGKSMWPIFGSGVGEVHDRISAPSKFQHDCGFQCVEWIVSCLSNQPVEPMTPENAIQFRDLVWRKWYSNGYQSVVPQSMILGGHNELETAVCAILKEHGVFMDRVQDRAKLIIQKLGQQAITGALKSTRPWQSLKQLANMQTPSFRLIQDDEFQAILKDRTKDGAPIKTQKKTPFQKKPRVDPVVFLPKDIHIPDGVFAQADGEIVGQIGVRQVHPKAKGVVLVQEYEWAPFRGQKTISSEGLGFLVMAPYSQEVAQLGEELRFPAQSVNTGEPILLTAVLIQHGSKAIGRFQTAQPQSVEQIETQTIKVLLYRDQCPVDWKEVIPKPIKAVLSMLECLQLCDKSDCQCNKSHRDTIDVDPIIDLWQRDFVSVHFQKTKPDQAAIFTCFMRIAKTSLPVVISQSGQDGIYIEPRQQDGRKIDDSYHTVWLNKQSYDEARAMQTTATMPVSLVRVTNRYGLRVEAKFGQQLHHALKPESPFISNGVKTHFVLGPLPFGTTKKAMMKLFEQWGWVAQPIHPCGRSQDQKGLMWKVVAGSPPQHLVYTMAHGDVMITRETVTPAKEISVPQVEASRFTKTKMTNGGEHQPDQLRTDPWAAAASKLPAPANRGLELTPAQLASMEAKIESNLMSKMPNLNDISMEANEDRISALESQFLELKQSQQQCVDQTNRVSVKMDTLQQQVETQASTFQSCLAQQMEDQMKRIESLLNKRKATE